MSVFLHLRDGVYKVRDQGGIPVPLDPDLLFLAENAKQQNIIQELYRVQMERNRSRHMFGDWEESDHPRGQPGNAGQFVEGGSSGGKGTERPDREETYARGAGGSGVRSPEQAQRSAAQAASGRPKLEGLPDEPIKLGDGYYVFGPSGKIHDTADSYMKKAGLTYNPPHRYVHVDADNATDVAEAFAQMKHDPDDPKVKAAYDALVKETLAQWQEVKKTGLKVQWIKEGDQDPYVESLNFIHADNRDNDHLWEFPTDLGYGTEDPTARNNNPMLQPTDEVVDGHKCLVNDIFRIVHDYFGHFKDGVSFTDDGEENAWRSHASMYSPLARGALTTETRGQAAWVNHGPHGEANRTASVADIVYAPQKIGLMPSWTWDEDQWRDAEFKEDEHPRDEDGKFTAGHRAGSKRQQEVPSVIESPAAEPPKEAREASYERPRNLPKSLITALDDQNYKFERTNNPDDDSARHVFTEWGTGSTIEYGLQDWGAGHHWEHRDAKSGRRYMGYGNLALIGHLRRYAKGEVFDSKFAKEFGDKLFESQSGFRPFLESDNAVAFTNGFGDQIYLYKDEDKAALDTANWKIYIDHGDGTGKNQYNEGHGWDDLKSNLSMLEDAHLEDKQKRETANKRYVDLGHDMMKSLGYDPSYLTVTHEEHPFTLNGVKRYAAGTAQTTNGRIALYAKQLEGLSDHVIRGIVAHEVTHQKFQRALDVWHKERDKPADQRDYGSAAKLAELLDFSGDGFDRYSKTDGVTQYSRDHWRAYKSGEENWELAFHETLAEMAHLEVTDPAELKAVAKPWRDLYKEVLSLYRTQPALRSATSPPAPQPSRPTESDNQSAAVHPAVHKLAQALHEVLHLGDKEWNKADHPQAPEGAPEGKGGQFVSKGEGGGGTTTTPKEEKQRVGVLPQIKAPVTKAALPDSAKDSHPAMISSRVPTTKGATDDRYRRADLAAMKENDQAFDHNTSLFDDEEHYPNFQPGELDCPPAKGDASRCAEYRAQVIMEHMKANLRFLYKNAPKEVREQGHLWYEGAHKLAKADAEKYGLPLQSVVGIYAALSPQTLWDLNVHLAKTVLDVYHTKQDFKWDKAMEDKAQEIWSAKNKLLLSGIRNNTLGELTDPVAKAMWIRTYDETYNKDRSFNALSPDGRVVGKYKNLDGSNAQGGWNSIPPIVHAIISLESGGDRDIISPAMGERHKVRSFYNNILDPDSDNDDVTVDTHAVGAALLRALGGSTVPVMHSFGKGPSTKAESERIHYRGTSSKGVSTQGLYAIYAEAYRELAKELKIKPRVLQSITWEAKRRLFDERMTDEAKQSVERAWRTYRDGKASLDKTQKDILKLAGGFARGQEKSDDNASKRSAGEVFTVGRRTGDARQLDQFGIRSRTARPADTGRRGYGPGGIAIGARRIWQNARLAVFLR
jgi:hypothetical protein